jgi:hypothetical protein
MYVTDCESEAQQRPAERSSFYAGLWQTASMLFPSGSNTKAA